LYKAKILFKDNKIACCSQMCDKTCPNFNKCRTYNIDIKKVKNKSERLTFNYIEKLMSHDSYERHNGAISQKRWGR
jgi:hypothetical protein